MRRNLDLANSALIAFIQENQYAYVSSEEFNSLSIPEGLDCEDVWDLLSFVRSIQGRPQVKASGEAVELLAQHNFWVATPAMIETFTRLAYVCSDTAPLIKDLEKSKSRDSLQDLLAEELWAASIREGLRVEREVIGELIRDEARNSLVVSDQAHIVANCIQILNELAKSASDEALPSLTTDRLLTMYNALHRGVSEISAEPLKTLVDNMSLTKKELSVWLDDVVETANSPYLWGPHPLFSMLLNADIFWESRPFGQLDGFMEIIVWHYMCLYHHVPALRFIPLSKMRLDWEHGLVPVGSPVFEHGKAIVYSRFGLDSTPYVQVMTGLIDRGVERLQAIACKARELDEAQKEVIAADGRLTLRQKSLLQLLVDEPDKTFTLTDYQHRFDIALSTARTDVEGLVNMHWLEDEFEGKRRVYRLRRG